MYASQVTFSDAEAEVVASDSTLASFQMQCKSPGPQTACLKSSCDHHSPESENSVADERNLQPSTRIRVGKPPPRSSQRSLGSVLSIERNNELYNPSVCSPVRVLLTDDIMVAVCGPSHMMRGKVNIRE